MESDGDGYAVIIFMSESSDGWLFTWAMIGSVVVSSSMLWFHHFTISQLLHVNYM